MVGSQNRLSASLTVRRLLGHCLPLPKCPYDPLGIVPYFDPSHRLTSILISRFILNLRGIFLSPGGSNATTSTLRMSQMSSLHFASSIAGNLGAPLGDLVDAEDRIDDSSTARGEVAYVSDDPLAAGLHPEEDEESLVPTERNLKE